MSLKLCSSDYQWRPITESGVWGECSQKCSMENGNIPQCWLNLKTDTEKACETVLFCFSCLWAWEAGSRVRKSYVFLCLFFFFSSPQVCLCSSNQQNTMMWLLQQCKSLIHHYCFDNFKRQRNVQGFLAFIEVSRSHCFLMVLVLKWLYWLAACSTDELSRMKQGVMDKICRI